MSDDEKKKDILKRGRDYSLFRFYETPPPLLPIPFSFPFSVSLHYCTTLMSEWRHRRLFERDRFWIQCSMNPRYDSYRMSMNSHEWITFKSRKDLVLMCDLRPVPILFIPLDHLPFQWRDPSPFSFSFLYQVIDIISFLLQYSSRWDSNA